MDKKRAEQLFNEHLTQQYRGLDLPKLGWKFGGFSSRKRSAGHCKMKTKSIYLSAPFLEFTSEEQLINTILHEIAHAIDFEFRGGSSHDRTWRTIAKSIGCDPDFHPSIFKMAEVYGDQVYSEFNYVLTCEKCGILTGFVRKPRRDYENKYKCSTCKGKLKLKKVEKDECTT